MPAYRLAANFGRRRRTRRLVRYSQLAYRIPDTFKYEPWVTGAYGVRLLHLYYPDVAATIASWPSTPRNMYVVSHMFVDRFIRDYIQITEMSVENGEEFLHKDIPRIDRYAPSHDPLPVFPELDDQLYLQALEGYMDTFYEWMEPEYYGISQELHQGHTLPIVVLSLWMLFLNCRTGIFAGKDNIPDYAENRTHAEYIRDIQPLPTLDEPVQEKLINELIPQHPGIKLLAEMIEIEEDYLAKHIATTIEYALVWTGNIYADVSQEEFWEMGSRWGIRLHNKDDIIVEVEAQREAYQIMHAAFKILHEFNEESIDHLLYIIRDAHMKKDNEKYGYQPPLIPASEGEAWEALEARVAQAAAA